MLSCVLEIVDRNSAVNFWMLISQLGRLKQSAPHQLLMFREAVKASVQLARTQMQSESPIALFVLLKIST
jgi:hypothetical protein